MVILLLVEAIDFGPGSVAVEPSQVGALFRGELGETASQVIQSFLFAPFFFSSPWLLLVGLAFLALVGPRSERFLGKANLIVLYWLAGFVGEALDIMIAPASTRLLTGSGAAVAGILGGLFVSNPRGTVGFSGWRIGTSPRSRLPISFVLLLWLAIWFVPGVRGGFFSREPAWGPCLGLFVGAAIWAALRGRGRHEVVAPLDSSAPIPTSRGTDSGESGPTSGLS